MFVTVCFAHRYGQHPSSTASARVHRLFLVLVVVPQTTFFAYSKHSLSITTKPASSSGITLHKLMDHASTLGCGPATMARKSTGTTVRLTNLFHRLPIRRKRMVPRLELDDIVKRVERWLIFDFGNMYTVP